MLMTSFDLVCNKCEFRSSNTVAWGDFRYVSGGLEIPLTRRLGWCPTCSNFVPMEDFSRDHDLSAKIEDALKALQARSNRWASFNLLKRTRKQSQDELENLSALIRKLALMADRKRVERCLECGSVDVMQCSRFFSIADPFHSSQVSIDTDFLHPGCGGEFLALNPIETDNVLTKRFYTLDGRQLGIQPRGIELSDDYRNCLDKPRLLKLRLKGKNLCFTNAAADKQPGSLSEGLTLIAGQVGQSEIVEQLRNEFESTPLGEAESEITEYLTRLTFSDQSTVRPSGGMPWEFLASILALPQLSGRRNELEWMIVENIRQILSEKIESMKTKFSSQLASPDQLTVSISNAGALSMSNGEKDISYNFQAASEVTVLYFSTIAALREMLSLDLPLVVDTDLVIDHFLQHHCFDFICGMSDQVVFLERKSVMKDLGVTPNYWIKPVSELGWTLTANKAH